MDELNQWLSARNQQWEALCRNCGACCGIFEDPCENLRFGPDGSSYCAKYENRLGPQKTVSGRSFNCVNIRDKVGQSWPGDSKCGYKISST